MNFQNLEYFLTVVQEGSITSAAERLGLSQQALSNQINRMEQEMDCRLFNRRHGLSLTAEGRYFLDSANRILDISRQTRTAIDDIKENRRGELKLGIAHTRGQAVLPMVLPSFTERYPKVRLTLLEDTTANLASGLERGAVDVLIDYKSSMMGDIETADLMEEYLSLVIPKLLLEDRFGSNWPKIAAQYEKHPDLNLFADFPFIRSVPGERIRSFMDKEFRLAKMKPEAVLEVSNTQTAVSLAAEGIGICACPNLYLESPFTASGKENGYIHNRVIILPVAPGKVYDTVSIGYRRDSYLGQIAKDFIRLTQQSFKERKKE